MRKFLVLLAAAMLCKAAFAATIEMDVNGLVCAFCAQGIEKRCANSRRPRMSS